VFGCRVVKGLKLLVTIRSSAAFASMSVKIRAASSCTTVGFTRETRLFVLGKKVLVRDSSANSVQKIIHQ
jgi:hypothetical protein